MSTQIHKTEVTVSNRTVLRILALVVLAYLGVRATISLSHPITLILIAFFLAMAINPAVKWISSKFKIANRTLATAAAFVTVLALLIGFFSLVIPPLAQQVGDFVQDIPGTIQDVKAQDSALGRTVRRYNLDHQVDEFSNNFGSKLRAGPLLDTASRVGEVLVSILAVLAMTFMMLNEGPVWVERLVAIMPSDKRQHRRELVRQMYGMVTGYVNAQIIMATIAASALLITLLISSTLLHVSINAVALAGIMAIFGLIPMIGNPIGAALVVLACLLSSLNLAIVIAIYFAIYMQIENVTLQPYVQSRQNELTPLTVFASALLGISFAGVIGALFAIPIAGCIRIVLMDWAGRKGYVKPAKQAG